MFWFLVVLFGCYCSAVAQNNNQPVCRDSAALNPYSASFSQKKTILSFSHCKLYLVESSVSVFQFLKCQYWVWLHWLILWFSDSLSLWVWFEAICGSQSQSRCVGKICFLKHLYRGYDICFFFLCVFYFCHSFSHLLTSPAPWIGGPCWKSPFSLMCCSWQPVPHHHLAKRWQSDWRNK